MPSRTVRTTGCMIFTPCGQVPLVCIFTEVCEQTSTRKPLKVSSGESSPLSHQLCKSNFHLNVRAAATIMALLFVLDVAMPDACAQTYRVLHNFTGGLDGANPWAGLTMDAGGNLYGIAAGGGSGSCVFNGTAGCGEAFKLTSKGGNWTFAPLYSFQGGNDGEFPVAAMTIGSNGSLYGTTAGGGGGSCAFNQSTGCGTVFNLKPTPTRPPTPLSPWLENVLYAFTGGGDGANPNLGNVVFDQEGNLYGTTFSGGILVKVLFSSCRAQAAAGRRPSCTTLPEVVTEALPTVALSSITLAISTARRYMAAAQDAVGRDAAQFMN